METDRDAPETTSFSGESAEEGPDSTRDSEQVKVGAPDGGLEEHLDSADDWF